MKHVHHSHPPPPSATCTSSGISISNGHHHTNKGGGGRLFAVGRNNNNNTNNQRRLLGLRLVLWVAGILACSLALRAKHPPGLSLLMTSIGTEQMQQHYRHHLHHHQHQQPPSADGGDKDEQLLHADRKLYQRSLLDVSSMWGMGADARTPMKRRKHVPLVTWTTDATGMLERALRDLQDSTTCDRTLYMYPYYWGLTSQTRDYSDAAIVALASGRTLQYVQDAYRLKWCAEDAWIECFFQPLSGDSCRRTQSELKSVPMFDTKKWNEFMPKETHAMLSGDTRAVHVVNNTRFDFVVEYPEFFPHDLWERMISKRFVRAIDAFGHELDWAELKSKQPNLYYTLSLSALRTMLTPILFKPKPELEAAAQARASALTKPHHDCAAVHIRWTDKKEDGGVSKKTEFSVDHVEAALERLERRTGLSYQCLLVLSDDDVAVVRVIQEKLGDTYAVKPVSQLHELFTSKQEYETYRAKGHIYFELEVLQHDPDRSFAYAREVIIDILTASKAADFLIGAGSSGVSQLLAQYMGAERRLDANALAIWQEDVLMI